MGHRRHSSITRMPPELRREIERLLGEGRTYDEIVGAVRTLGGQVSRSAVGRHALEWRELTDRLRLAREMSQAIGRELDEVDGDAGRLVIESLQGLLLQAQLELGKDAVDPATIASMSRAVRDLQSALKTNVDTEFKIRERAAKDAAKAVEQVATEQGLSGPTVEAIKASILGIARRAT
jgi:hypothetical protein